MIKNFFISVILMAVPVSGGFVPVEASENGGSALYSEALYFKNLALQSSDSSKKTENLDLAIGKLKEAEKSGEALGRVYNQLSEIYFMKNDDNASEMYALLAVENEKDFFPPYNRLYGIYMKKNKYAEAAAAIERYLKVDPDDPYSLYLMGVHYFRYHKDTEKSLEYFEKEISVSKRREVAPYYLENSYYNIGYIYYSKYNFSEAYRYFARAYALNDSNRNTIFMLAETAFENYDLESAEKYSKLFLSLVPGDLNVQYILGSVYYINGNKEALKYLSSVRRVKVFKGLIAMALYYELAGEDRKAEAVILSIMKYRKDLLALNIAYARIKLRSGNSEEAYKALVASGTECFRKGVFNAAEKMFYRALELKKDDNGEIYYFLARTHEENRKYMMAISYYNRYYAFSRENNILVHIGYIYGTQRKYDSAYRYFKRAVKLAPENPGAYFFWGLVQIWEGKYRDARDNILKSISIKGDEETYYFYLAVVYEKLKDSDKAIESLKNAIRYNNNSGRSLNYLGYLYADMNINIEEAMSLIQRALEIEPENGAYLDSLGWVFFRKGDYTSALKNLLLAEEKLDQSGNPDYVVYDHLGDTYLKLENRNRALYYWQKALKLERNEDIENKIKKYREQGNEK